MKRLRQVLDTYEPVDVSMVSAVPYWYFGMEPPKELVVEKTMTIRFRKKGGK